MTLSNADMIKYKMIYEILVIVPKIHDTVNHTDKYGMIYGTLASAQTLLTKYGMVHGTVVSSSMLIAFCESVVSCTKILKGGSRENQPMIGCQTFSKFYAMIDWLFFM